MLARIWGKANTCSLVLAMKTCTSTLEISLILPEKSRIISTSLFLHHSWAYTQKTTFYSMFIAILLRRARNSKHVRCPSVDEQRMKCGTFTQWKIIPLLKEMNLTSKRVELEKYYPKCDYTEQYCIYLLISRSWFLNL